MVITNDRSAGSADATRPALDADVLWLLSEDLGDIDDLLDIIDAFLAGLPGHLRVVANASTRDGVRRAAHTLKSSSRLLGLKALAEVAEQLEISVTRTWPSVGTDEIRHVVGSATAAAEALEQWRSQAAARH